MSSFDVNFRARLARLERENATLLRELQDANDANGVARAIAAASRVEDIEAERETQRAQMAERMANNAKDYLRYTLQMAQSSTADTDEAVKLQEEQEHSETENGKLQVESQTDRDLPANASAPAEDMNNVHARCQRERAELIRQFEDLCNSTRQQHADEKAALEAANSAELEATNKTREAYIEMLEGKITDATERLEVLHKEVEQNAQAAELVEILRNRLHSRETELDRLLEEQVHKNDAETSKTSERQRKELQDAEVPLKDEIRGLKHELENYEEELDKVRSENIKLQADLEDWKQMEKYLSENNELLLADLQDERHQRNSVAIERDELAVRFAEADQARQKLEESEAELRVEFKASQDEWDAAAQEGAQHHIRAQEEVDGLISRVEEQAGEIATRIRQIETLEHGIRALKTQNEMLKSQGKMLETFKRSQSQPVEDPEQEPALEITLQPNNNRSVSMANQTSLADELGFYDRSDHSSSVLDYTTEHVELELSRVNHISIAPHKVAKPQLTVAVGDAIATTPRVRQDSPFDQSPVSSDSSPAPRHSVGSLLAIFEHTVAEVEPTRPTNPTLALFGTIVEDLSPIEPKSAPLAVSIITSVDSEPIEIVKVLPDRPDQPHAPSTSLRHRPLEPYPRSSRLLNSRDLGSLMTRWPTEDESASERAASPTTQPAHPASSSPTIIGFPHSPVATSPCVISSAHDCGSDSSPRISLLLLLLILGFFSTSLLPVSLVLFRVCSASLQLHSALYKPVPIASNKALYPRIHYMFHALLLPLAFFCWRFWSQVHAWEHVNGVGFDEGFGGAYKDLGPYGDGHFLLSKLPLNWVSGDSQLPAKVVEVITSTVSAFEGLIGLGPTPSF
ncbi:hypothetical protein E8E12_006626 [Didymella heteroderae]|uniref:Uncharacterized protein n=1 Tax=Didymella heteroderae TaxID=1769908 RepID=A0A9P4WMP9_9PLEO|nr:hypothetical protein E8E12_006626 [Didymella heteroderae]